jgi:BASS family bile acid:Na+ symporter
VIAAARPILGLGVQGLLPVAALAVAGVIIGHLLGGPEHDTRVVLAAFATLRYPALALLVAGIAPGGRAVIPVILAYTIVSAIVVALYLALERTAVRRARPSAAARPRTGER